MAFTGILKRMEEPDQHFTVKFWTKSCSCPSFECRILSKSSESSLSKSCPSLPKSSLILELGLSIRCRAFVVISEVIGGTQ